MLSKCVQKYFARGRGDKKVKTRYVHGPKIDAKTCVWLKQVQAKRGAYIVVQIMCANCTQVNKKAKIDGQGKPVLRDQFIKCQNSKSWNIEKSDQIFPGIFKQASSEPDKFCKNVIFVIRINFLGLNCRLKLSLKMQSFFTTLVHPPTRTL